MVYNDIVFTPYSDTGVDEKTAINEHTELIKKNNFNGAASIASKTGKGFTASFFNGFREKIKILEVSLLNELWAEYGFYFSYNEPNEEEMPESATFFIQLLN